MTQPLARTLLGLASLIPLACTGIAGAQTVTQTTGPDIIVCSFPDVSNNATATIGGVVYDSFCVGTTSANRGNVPVNWWNQSTDNRHPAIAQNLFRYVPSTGRFEQLGQGSLKHGFTALQQNDCASPNYFNFGCTSTAGTTLGTGCADPYCCGLNNVLGSGGPKWQVNAATGLFAFPVSTTFQANSGPPRARLTDLQGAPAGTRYFMEGQYIVGDDAAANNKNNNASWQEVTMSPAAPAPTATNFTIALTGSIHREQPAIYAWQVIDPAVQIFTYDVPSDGRFILACKVSGPVGGLYTYEYALHNLNSNRCAGSLVVPLPGTQAALTNVGFHDVEAVSEPNQLANPATPASDDWTVSGGDANATSVSWSGAPYSGTPAVYTMDPVVPYKVIGFTAGTGIDHSANVLRWGTMFNFRFTSEAAPANTGQIAVGLWRPGTGTAFVMNNVPTPGGASIGNLTATCCNGITCTVATQTDCGGGLWGLPGTVCTPNPCTNGACCLPGLTCSLFSGASCAAQGGAYRGDGVTCANASPVCPFPGACCAANGSCTQTNSAACTAISSSAYRGDSTTCSPAMCPTGGCCPAGGGACTITASNGCTSAGSTYRGDGSTCATPCPFGACCFGNTLSCTNLNPTPCGVQGGIYQGDGSSCASAQCPFGACCQGCAGCVISTSNACTGTGNTYLGNFSTCATGGCSIANSGFETGAFSPGWTQFGNTGGTGVYATTFFLLAPHGGTHAAYLGPVGSTGGIQQIIPAHAGDQVNLGFWYAVRGGTAADSFTASFDGQTLLSLTNDSAHSNWTQYSFPVTVSANNPVLSFTVRDDHSYVLIDDVTVCITPGSGMGTCCRGATCTTMESVGCTAPSGTHAGAFFVSGGAGGGACNASGNSTSPCCEANYNKTGGVSVQDVFDFLGDWFAGSPYARVGGDGTGNAPTVQSIFDFLSAWFGGGC